MAVQEAVQAGAGGDEREDHLFGGGELDGGGGGFDGGGLLALGGGDLGGQQQRFDEDRHRWGVVGGDDAADHLAGGVDVAGGVLGAGDAEQSSAAHRLVDPGQRLEPFDGLVGFTHLGLELEEQDVGADAEHPVRSGSSRPVSVSRMSRAST